MHIKTKMINRGTSCKKLAQWWLLLFMLYTYYVHAYTFVTTRLVHILVLVFYAWWFNYQSSLTLSIDQFGYYMGLSITLKTGVKLLGWLWGAIAQWSKHLQLKQGPRVQFPFHWGFSSSHADGMKDLWCSSIQFGRYLHRYNGKKDLWSGVLVQFGCYQHRCELLMEGSVVL